MKKLFFMLSLIAGLFLVSCGSSEDKVKTIDKDGAVAVQLSTKHFDMDRDIVVSTYEIWKKNQLVTTYTKYDTVPSLGMMTSEDENGDAVRVPKEYEFYITLK